jgi:hypothetical protein
MHAKHWLENLKCGYHLAKLRSMRTLKYSIEMDLEQGYRIWRGFFWLRLGTVSFCGKNQLQTAVENLFDDSGSITGRGTNFLFDAADQSPFLPIIKFP